MNPIELFEKALDGIEYTILELNETTNEYGEYMSTFSLVFKEFGVALIKVELMSQSMLVNMTYTSRNCSTVFDTRMFDVSVQGLSTVNNRLKQFLLTVKIGGDVSE